MLAEIFFTLLIAGLILIGAEIFVPGGILGIMGGLALFGAVVLGFMAFPGCGAWIAIGILGLVGVIIVLWVKIFPRTELGKRMTVSTDLKTWKATNPGLESLSGKEGVASSELRPAGFAEIEGRRVDVVTRGEMISAGSTVRVLDVESNRVVVAEIDPGKE